ncbi:hypothetical protein GCM10009087_46160 [Sphingomonas oligophenolica]|uniref:ABM domain-containing protein n=1 Tax=Sphingomonas oligophenolica TaxID=301154 RepID=A0ABU9Y0E9_9SPHN
MAEAIEITSFRLIEGSTSADFVAANDAGLTQWLARQPGFLSRDIAEVDHGSIVDLLHWASKAQAQSAADRLLAETADSAVHGMIDKRTVQWQLSEIRDSTPRRR